MNKTFNDMTLVGVRSVLISVLRACAAMHDDERLAFKDELEEAMAILWSKGGHPLIEQAIASLSNVDQYVIRRWRGEAK